MSPEQEDTMRRTLQEQEQTLLRLQAQLSAQRSALLMLGRGLQTYGFFELRLLADDLDDLANQQPSLSIERTELVSLRAEVQRMRAQVESAKRERLPPPKH